MLIIGVKFAIMYCKQRRMETNAMSSKQAISPELKAKIRTCFKRSVLIALVPISLPWFVCSDVGNATCLSVFGGLLIFFIVYYSQWIYFKIPFSLYQGSHNCVKERWLLDPNDSTSIAYRWSYQERDSWYDSYSSFRQE
jgi:hypothetical protein